MADFFFDFEAVRTKSRDHDVPRRLIDGTQFDSSFDRGKPSTFAPNQVIKGWTEAMQLMVEGCVEINQ